MPRFKLVAEKFKRETGLSLSGFNELVDKVTAYIDVKKKETIL